MTSFARDSDASRYGALVDAMRRAAGRIGANESEGRPGDFTTTPRVILISLMAIVIGVISAFIALALLRLIGLITNAAFLLRFNTTITPIQDNTIGWGVIFVPAIGGLLIGLMARYGSDKIRGHGIPEAIEVIQEGDSAISPRVAILKPASTAISIGTGGPFGAEGVIIMTGGAAASLIAQWFHLTAAERKTLLVAGAAAGLAAVFATPVTAVFLAIEILLFEFKPRSLIPVALACAVAGLVRHDLIGPGPLFTVPTHPGYIGYAGLAGCLLLGLTAGAGSLFLNVGIYQCERMFHRLPIHWMWWPAIAGLIAGLVGVGYPRALGPGYDLIGQLLNGDNSVSLIVGVLLLKSFVWILLNGSETSGGTLAPILMMGAALGAAEAHILPAEGAGFWPLIAMGAVLAGTLRAPLTGIMIAIEVTHDVNALLPLTAAVALSYGVTVLTLQRSMITEKIGLRGYHRSEFEVDPLSTVLVKEVMRTNITALHDSSTLLELATSLRGDHASTGQRLYPIVDTEGRLEGVISRTNLQDLVDTQIDQRGSEPISEMMNGTPVLAFPDESLSSVVYRMAQTGYTRMPVVERHDHTQLRGMVSLNDTLAARARAFERESRRERVLRVHLFRPHRRMPTRGGDSLGGDSVSKI